MSPLAPPCHALNNVLGKILAAAELGMDNTRDRRARAEFQRIARLVDEGARLVETLAAALRPQETSAKER
jgi:hypothetical protein